MLDETDGGLDHCGSKNCGGPAISLVCCVSQAITLSQQVIYSGILCFVNTEIILLQIHLLEIEHICKIKMSSANVLDPKLYSLKSVKSNLTWLGLLDSMDQFQTLLTLNPAQWQPSVCLGPWPTNRRLLWKIYSKALLLIMMLSDLAQCWMDHFCWLWQMAITWLSCDDSVSQDGFFLFKISLRTLNISSKVFSHKIKRLNQ